MIHALRGQFEECLHLPTLDGRESFLEIIDGVAGLEVIDQSVDRYTSASEYEIAAVDLGVAGDHGIG